MTATSAPPASGLMTGLLKRLREEVANWYVVGPLAWLILRSPARELLSRTRLRTLGMVIRLRDGRTLVCEVGEFPAFAEVFLTGEYDVPGLVDWDCVRTVVDVGANVGMAAVWFAFMAPGSRMVAVEPGPSALPRLRENISRNGLTERITVRSVALGASAGRGRLVTSDATVGLRVEEVGGIVEGGVPVLTLDDVISESGFDEVDLLKLDCEGAEYDILSSSGLVGLSRVQCIVGEYHLERGHTADELKEILDSAGFTPTLRSHPRDPSLGSFWAKRA